VLEARFWNAPRDLDLRLIWTKLEAWLLEHSPEGLASLQPGANESEIAAFEASIGQTLPPEVRFLYSLHNGQQDVLRDGIYCPSLGGLKPSPSGESFSRFLCTMQSS
jgi:hypothetical protein